MRFLKGLLLSLLSLFTLVNSWGQSDDSLSLSNPADTLSISDTISDILSTDEKTDTLQADEEEVDTLPKQKIEIEFVKEKVEHSPDSIYFNICKVTNTTTERIKGNFEVRVPNGWNLIANPSAGIELDAGETKIFVIRVALSNQAIGGIAYSIDASVTTKNAIYSNATYIKIPMVSDWEMHVNRNTIYFNEYFNEKELKVYLKNDGNAEELIKLNFTIGKLFVIEEISTPEFYISLPPKTDTALTYTVKKALLNADELFAYKQMWNESIIRIVAQSEFSKRYSESVQFIDLENEYVNIRQEKSSPFNVDLSIFNLLSSIQPRLNAAFYGEVQFKGDQDVQYFIQGRNLRYNNPQGAFLLNGNNFTFNATYRWQKKLSVQIGEINNYAMHSMRGWGIRSFYNLNKDSRITASYITGKYFPLQGFSTRYDTKIRKIGVHVGATYEDNNFLYYDAISAQTGVAFSIAKNHIIRATILGTRSVYDKNQGVGPFEDTTVLGVSYLLSYASSIKKLRIGASTRNDQFNFLRIRPANTANGYVRYIINNKSRLNLTGNYRNTIAPKLNFIPFLNGSYNNQQIYKLSYTNQITKMLSFESGPTFRVLNRRNIIADTVNADFTNNFYGAYALTRVRFDEFRLLTPMASAGVTTFTNELLATDSIPTLPAFNVGISYTDRNWGANARYIYGPNFFLSENFFNFDIIGFETVSFRAYYNKFLFDRKIMFSGYGNYYLRLPSNRQNFAFSGRFDFILPQRWKIYASANVYTNSSDANGEGVVTFRNFSLNAGIVKSFDIPQPRIKYYELTVICFNDIDGNGERDKNEPLLPNIKVRISQDLGFKKYRHDVTERDKIRFGEQELITGVNGQLKVIDIPEDNYVLEFESLVNLGNLYNEGGDKQALNMSENTTLYVPYVESYKVRGKVILNRDEYSSLGLINLGGIRITATNLTNYKIYTALTDNEGNYLINVPQGGAYKVSVNNIFGNAFEIDKEEFLIQFSEFKSFNVDFTFFEGKREVSFGGNSFFNFKSLNTSDPEPINVNSDIMYDTKLLNLEVNRISYENLGGIESPLPSEEVNYNLCIGINNDKVTPNQRKSLRSLGFAETDFIVEGMTIYISRAYETEKAAMLFEEDVKATGFTNSILVGSYKGKIISRADVDKAKK